MNITLTDYNHDRKILAVKGTRAVTGYSLREALDTVNKLEGGEHVVIEVADGSDASVVLATLTEHGVSATGPEPVALSPRELLDIFETFDPNLLVSDIVQVLRAVVQVSS